MKDFTLRWLKDARPGDIRAEVVAPTLNVDEWAEVNDLAAKCGFNSIDGVWTASSLSQTFSDFKIKMLQAGYSVFEEKQP